MGRKLEAIFNEAEALGGLKARMRMAVLVRMDTLQASAELDTRENILKFEQALIEIKKEFN